MPVSTESWSPRCRRCEFSRSTTWTTRLQLSSRVESREDNNAIALLFDTYAIYSIVYTYCTVQYWYIYVYGVLYILLYYSTYSNTI